MSGDAPEPMVLSRRYDRQNVALVVSVSVAWLVLLAIASHGGPFVLVGTAVLFTLIGIPLDALMHQSFHDNLHSDPQKNARLGAVVCALFPASFTMLRASHPNHHRNNRSEHEVFDLLLPGDKRWLKISHWYGILLGLYAAALVSFSFGLALCPRLFETRPFTHAKTTGPLFSKHIFTAVVVRRIRFEMASAVIAWLIAFVVLALDPLVVLMMYAAFWLSWSTRNYVGHAFSPRHIVEGAHDLRAGALHQALLLNGNLELTHHRHPDARWQELPARAVPHDRTLAYWRLWARMWRGPQASREPAPEPLQ